LHPAASTRCRRASAAACPGRRRTAAPPRDAAVRGWRGWRRLRRAGIDLPVNAAVQQQPCPVVPMGRVVLWSRAVGGLLPFDGTEDLLFEDGEVTTVTRCIWSWEQDETMYTELLVPAEGRCVERLHGGHGHFERAEFGRALPACMFFATADREVWESAPAADAATRRVRRSIATRIRRPPPQGVRALPGHTATGSTIPGSNQRARYRAAVNERLGESEPHDRSCNGELAHWRRRRAQIGLPSSASARSWARSSRLTTLP
jgi:hypothetical protein